MKEGSLFFIILGYFTLMSARGCREMRAYSEDTATHPTSAALPDDVRMITAKEADVLLRNGSAVLVDFREEKEVLDGMAEPARWMPLSRMNEGDPKWDDFLGGIPKDKLVICYCTTGKRAAKASQKMKARGYTVANMGGYADWVYAGLPTKRPKIPPHHFK